jgi:hypothetical protein
VLSSPLRRPIVARYLALAFGLSWTVGAVVRITGGIGSPVRHVVGGQDGTLSLFGLVGKTIAVYRPLILRSVNVH